MATAKSKTTDGTGVAAAAPEVEQDKLPAEDDTMPVQAAFQITLNEFMIKLSQRDKRVELINGFYYTERKRGSVKDFESNFQARFVAFTQLVIED